MHPTSDPEDRATGPSALALAPVALGALLAPAAVDARTTAVDGMRAIEPAEQAETLDATLAQGRALLTQGQVVLALQQYSRAMAMAPESVEAMNGAAVCYDRMGRFESARTLYEMALGLEPQSGLLLNNYGYSLYLQGDKREAARFLSLAAASGDAEVSARALKILGKIDTARQPAAPAVAQAATPEPMADPARIVRTSDHELRLVLADPQKPAPARQREATTRLAAVLGSDLAAAIVPVGGLSKADDRRIALAEAQAIRADAAEAAEAARAQVVPGLLMAANDLGLGPRVGALPADAADVFAPARPDALATDSPDWNRFQLLMVAKADGPAPHRPGTGAAVIAAGLVPQPRRLAATARPELEPEARLFTRPFESDDARLNGLANRLHADSGEPDVAEKIARLEALIERMQAIRAAA